MKIQFFFLLLFFFFGGGGGFGRGVQIRGRWGRGVARFGVGG